MPMRSSSQLSFANRSEWWGPIELAIRIPSSASTRWSSSIHAAQLSTRWVNTESAQTRSKWPSSNGRPGSASLRTACSGGQRFRCSQSMPSLIDVAAPDLGRLRLLEEVAQRPSRAAAEVEQPPSLELVAGRQHAQDPLPTRRRLLVEA